MTTERQEMVEALAYAEEKLDELRTTILAKLVELETLMEFADRVEEIIDEEREALKPKLRLVDTGDSND